MKKKSAARTVKKQVGRAESDKALRGGPGTQRAVAEQPVIVGIGASAGGLEAFTELFSALPADTGLAFVVIQHLEPKHNSLLPGLLARATNMPVREATHKMGIQPNHVYVIPAGADMTVRGGTLHILKRKKNDPHPLSVDHFLSSLAEAQGPRAIGVVLSGTGSDGTEGVKAIKLRGGITLAQDVESARFDGMPRSAVASGYVDLVLPPGRIAGELTRIARQAFVGMPTSDVRPMPAPEEEWARLFYLLRKARGVDFSLYKQSTIKRRLALRMAVCNVDGLTAYLKLAEQNQAEIRALFDQLLIPVTGFFRDRTVFDLLRSRVIPKIVADKTVNDAIRIWVAGCSTGEEAYSIAIIVLECLGSKARGARIQIFGTDISDHALEKARLGIYTRNDLKGVSRERLERYFTPVEGAFQINQPVREICLFARHDLTRDPPYSRLDMISCRNVMIYMEPVLQKRILGGFHWALNPDGVLLLGKTESLGAQPDLFIPTDRRNKLFRKTAAAILPLGIGHPAFEHAAATMPVVKEIPGRGDVEREADLALWNRSGYAGLVVNDDLQILHVRGDTSPYIRLVPGKASLQLMRSMREEIVLEVRSALDKARRTGKTVRTEGIEFRHNSHISTVNVEVRALVSASGQGRPFLILFEPGGTRPVGKKAEEAKSDRPGRQSEADQLREELTRTREYLQAIIRDQETSSEELKSASEEALSSMEELQSTNEELETAKEELQSSNEELITLNDQLQNRNSELAQLSADLGSVLSGIDIPVVILDSERRIRRFTLPAEKLLGLIEGDIGRPIGKLRIGINISNLDGMIAAAMEKGAPAEQEVQAESGQWYSLRVHPFVAGEDKVRGVLLVLVNIDVAKKLQQKTVVRAEQSESLVRALLETATQAVLAVDNAGLIRLANASAETMFGRTRQALVGKSLELLLPKRLRAPHVAHRAAWFASPQKRPMGIGLALAGLREDGSEFPIEVSLSSIESGGGTLAAAFISDITERKRNEDALAASQARLSAEVTALARLVETTDRLWQSHDLRGGLEQMIDAGNALLGADLGNIQLLNPEKQVLEIVAQRGFEADFLEHFREVQVGDTSACGRSLRSGTRIVIEDVNADEEYAPHRAIASAAGYRAVQSTPLKGPDGNPIGMFSTYFRDPHRPTDDDLVRFDFYANQAVQFIRRIRSDSELQSVSGRLLAMQESGNREIARELHDVFSQELAGVGIELSSLQSELRTNRDVSKRLGAMEEKIRKLSVDIHRTSRELHPSILDDLGLVPALRQECETFQQRSGIHTEFRAANVPAKLPQDVALCLYRVAQEALRNVQKHTTSAGATVRLDGGERGIALRVEDSGGGFDFAAALRKGGLGLISMEERVRLVNGKLTLDSRPGSGSVVNAFIPLSRGGAKGGLSPAESGHEKKDERQPGARSPEKRR